MALMQIYQHVGLALATSLVSWLVLIWQAGWLACVGRLNGSAVTIIFKAVVAAAVMAAGLYLALSYLYLILSSDFIIMVCSVILGMCLYLVAGYILVLTKILLKIVKQQRA